MKSSGSGRGSRRNTAIRFLTWKDMAERRNEVMDMVAQDSVLYICRDMYKYLAEVNPTHDYCYWRRGDRIGWGKRRLTHG